MALAFHTISLTKSSYQSTDYPRSLEMKSFELRNLKYHLNQARSKAQHSKV